MECYYRKSDSSIGKRIYENYFERQRKLRLNCPYIETYFKDGKSWKTHANIPDFDKKDYAKTILSYDNVIKIVIDGVVFSKSLKIKNRVRNAYARGISIFNYILFLSKNVYIR